MDCRVQPEERIGNVRVSAVKGKKSTPRKISSKPLPIPLSVRLRLDQEQSSAQKGLRPKLLLPHRPTVSRLDLM
jgi:hypothetical protein